MTTLRPPTSLTDVYRKVLSPIPGSLDLPLEPTRTSMWKTVVDCCFVPYLAKLIQQKIANQYGSKLESSIHLTGGVLLLFDLGYTSNLSFPQTLKFHKCSLKFCRNASSSFP